MGRAPCCDKENVKKGPWSPEEDAKLKAYIEQYGTGGNWIALPQKIGLKRCGKSCRLRWLNYLRPNIKHGGFTEEEDNTICNLYISIGSRWSIIAAQLPGRTDNDIKNYWNTKLKKKLLGRRKQSNRSTPEANGVEDSSSSHALSNSALERLQLHTRLQRLQDPFSFYNNHALWPKLHPLQEKLLLQSLSESSINNPHMQHVLPSTLPMGNPQKVNIYEHVPGDCTLNSVENDFSKLDKSEVDVLENASPVIASSNNVMALNMAPISDAIIQSVSNIQGEFEDFGNNKSSRFTPQDYYEIPGSDCFKEMNFSKDNLSWWSSEFETRSTSSNSWESNSVLQSQDIFQDYDLGYNM